MAKKTSKKMSLHDKWAHDSATGGIRIIKPAPVKKSSRKSSK